MRNLRQAMADFAASERARIARAIWAYTGLDQQKLAEAAHIKYSRMRAILAREKPDEATLDELLALARTAGIPDRFALEGFASRNGRDLEQRVASLEARVNSADEDREDLASRIDEIDAALEKRLATFAMQVLERRRSRRRQEDPPGQADPPIP